MNISSSLIVLQPGMYILRHPGEGRPPLTITQTPKGAGRVDFMATRKASGMLIADPTDCVVIHIIEAAVELLVATHGDVAADKADEPALRIDKIALADRALPAAAAVPAGKSVPVDKAGLLLVGHIERQGDVIVKPGEMLGNPAASLRLEGFQVEWVGRPEGVDLAYGVAIEGHGALPAVTTGHFAGTRSQARRITEVTLSLVGPQAGKYKLGGTACFSGGFRMPVVSGVPIGGPSGMEHLTALQLSVQAVKSKAGSAKSIWDESPRTKVFGAGKSGAGKTASAKKAAAPTPARKPAATPAPKAATKAAPKPVTKAASRTKVAPKAVPKPAARPAKKTRK